MIPELLDPDLLASAREETIAICRADRGAVDGVIPADPADDGPI